MDLSLGKLFKKRPEAPSPEEVPSEQLTPLSKKYMDWKTGMVIVVGVLLVFTFLNTFVQNPSISGYSVVDADDSASGRFSNMASVLVIIFAFFGLFIFVITRKLDLKRGK